MLRPRQLCRPKSAGVLLLAGVALALPPGHGQSAHDPPARIADNDRSHSPAYAVLGVVGANELRVRLEPAGAGVLPTGNAWADHETVVRLIGTHVPHSGSAAADARAFLTRLLEGESVYLEYDANWPRPAGEQAVWAYVYRAPDGLFVNLELVRQGYARVAGAEPFEQETLLGAYERRAQRSGRGIWSTRHTRAAASRPATAPRAESDADSAAGDDELVYVTAHGRKYHRKDCQYVRNGGTALTLQEARARGYSPCAKCRPPQ